MNGIKFSSFKNIAGGSDINGENMDEVAKETINLLEGMGQDGRLISDHRDVFDRIYTDMRRDGKSSNQATKEAIAAVALKVTSR